MMDQIRARVRAWRHRWETRAMDVVYDLTRVSNDGSFASHRRGAANPSRKTTQETDASKAKAQDPERQSSEKQDIG